jgi:GDP-L-fucose synthase
MNILITGGNGFIGSSIKLYLDSIDMKSISLSRKDFDLSCYESTKEWFVKNDQYFDVVIHTAIKGGSRLKEDDCDIIDNNLKMYYNLISNNKYFHKFINLSSGAEYSQYDKPYGLSKRTISESIKCKKNYFNLRIYSLFNENELNTRFIKNNIHNYILNQNITIFQNKLMDFMYMKDFLSIVHEYIINSNLPHQIDCVYNNKYSLSDIAKIINNLETQKVDIDILNTNLGEPYIGQYTDIGLKFIGTEQGINDTYSYMKDLL